MIESPSVVAHCASGDVRDLALARLPAQLADDLERLAPAVGMPLREMASARVDRQPAAELDAPAGDEVGGLAGRAEAEALERPEDLRREAVVAVERLDLGRRDAGAAEDRLARAERHVVEDLCLVDAEPGLAEDELVGPGVQALVAADVDRGARAGAPARSARVRITATAVSTGNRAVEQAQRLDDRARAPRSPARVSGLRITASGLRCAARALRERDGGELLAVDAVVVQVAPRRHRGAGDRRGEADPRRLGVRARRPRACPRRRRCGRCVPTRVRRGCS